MGGRKMLKLAIVEDELNQVALLKKYIEQFQEEEKQEIELTIYRDGDEILEDYKAQFDIILMDIQMKFVNGMSAAEEIRKMDTEVVIIFITNMSQYAIQGYKVDALDYVLKPVSYFAFSQRLKKAILKYERRNDKTITLQVKGGIRRVEVSSIYYIDVEGHKLVYHTTKGDFAVTGTMSQTEEALREEGFARGNKGYLINLKHVEAIVDYCAVVNGEKLVLSRPKRKEFMQAITTYWGEIR
jgi:Response regulator of the LytR/AlgR family